MRVALLRARMPQYIAAKKVQHREDKIKIINVPWKGFCGVYTVKKISDIPVPSRDVTYPNSL
jgi:hypothetical protein